MYAPDVSGKTLGLGYREDSGPGTGRGGARWGGQQAVVEKLPLGNVTAPSQGSRSGRWYSSSQWDLAMQAP